MAHTICSPHASGSHATANAPKAIRVFQKKKKETKVSFIRTPMLTNPRETWPHGTRTKPTSCISNGRWLERTETNLIHFKWGTVKETLQEKKVRVPLQVSSDLVSAHYYYLDICFSFKRLSLLRRLEAVDPKSTLNLIWLFTTPHCNFLSLLQPDYLN